MGGQQGRRMTEREDGRAEWEDSIAEREDSRAGGWQSRAGGRQGRAGGRQSRRTAEQEDGRAQVFSSVITVCHPQGSTELTRVSLTCLWWQHLLSQSRGHWPVSEDSFTGSCQNLRGPFLVPIQLLTWL